MSDLVLGRQAEHRDGAVYLTFGVHKGEELYEVPAHYLRWMLGMADLSSDLRDMIEDELEARDDD